MMWNQLSGNSLIDSRKCGGGFIERVSLRIVEVTRKGRGGGYRRFGGAVIVLVLVGLPSRRQRDHGLPVPIFPY